jgi:hypothetical protein
VARTTPLLALLLAALLAAGCTSGPATVADPPASGPEPGAEAALPALVVPRVLPPVRLGPGSGEPNIAVAPDGTIYVIPIDHIYRSRDGGSTWQDLGTQKTQGHGDGDLAIDATGRLHWLGLFAPDAPIPYQQSDDQGERFTRPLDLSNGTGADREWLDARPDGTLYASWRDSDDGGIIATRTSRDAGATWGPRVTMADDAVGGPIVHGPRPGEVYEAYTTFASSPAGGGSAIWIARSSDHGASWDSVRVAEPAQSVGVGLIGFPTSIFPVVAVDANGTLYLVFSADQRVVPQAVPKPAARFGVFLTVSHDRGSTWSAPRLLSDPGHAAVMPFIAAGAPGRIAVAWYENVAGLPHETLPDLWHVKLHESVAADRPDPDGVTVQLTTEPNHIGPVCTSGTGCLAGDRSLLDFFEVAITPAGQPVVAWASSVGGTGFGVAVQGTDTWFGTVEGTPLR